MFKMKLYSIVVILALFAASAAKGLEGIFDNLDGLTEEENSLLGELVKSNAINQLFGAFDDDKNTILDLFTDKLEGGSDLFKSLKEKVPVLDAGLLKTAFKSAHLIDKFTDNFCQDPMVIEGQKIPTQCQGPVFDLMVDGGACVIDPDTEVVTCYPPRVLLVKTAARCNLEFETATIVQGKECKLVKEFGEAKAGNVTKWTKSFQFGKSLDAEEGFSVFSDFEASISDLLGLND
eukprot:TRINITY_DN7043_c0_g2_i1.p3 TRINITY_DN7043_c0_g2~~TRINITY_DN7043_c0_g2_i1.p3  ORF type:complete len:234 (-),score=37.22 TRINITY_DN7043_c0_g2_i1:145-846(-)